MMANLPPSWLMATTCHFSYPLKSENASPPGTFTVYLSCAENAAPLTAAKTTAMIAMEIAFFFMSCLLCQVDVVTLAVDHPLMKVKRSGLIAPGCVVHMPCGRP